jgi:hypothetical protein
LRSILYVIRRGELGHKRRINDVSGFDDLGWPYGCRWRLASPHKTTARDYVLVTEENKACRSKWMRSWSSWPRNRPYAR